MEGLEIFICVLVCWRLGFNPYMRCNFAETENLKLFVACRNAFGWRLFPSSTCGRLEERSTLLKGFLHKWDKHWAGQGRAACWWWLVRPVRQIPTLALKLQITDLKLWRSLKSLWESVTYILQGISFWKWDMHQSNFLILELPLKL